MAKFYVGLTMAGAISAGAYTAGVFDFLIEALEEWEKRKRELRAAGTPESAWDVPSHDVVIPVMSGASAGGITGALGLLAAAEADAAPARYDYAQVKDVVSRLPRLYRAWVQMPCFIDPNGGPDLLGGEDMADGSARSLLDTTILSRIVDASLLGIREVASPRPYFAEKMHLFLTHSNVRGVPYEIGFAAGGPGQPGYGMMCHGDRAHFVVSGAGSSPFTSPWADPDPARAINLLTLPDLTAVNGVWQEYAQAALGSGAFPIGLRARRIKGATVADYSQRQWPIPRFKDDVASGQRHFRLPPAFPAALTDASEVGYVTVDGGLINNEPFELARWTLMKEAPQKNARDAINADRAVIMVDPFPEAPAYDAADSLDDGLSTILKRLFPTLKNQARFKPEDLADALDENVFSRFLIAPRRRKAAGAPLERHAIACGLLGGFGGFLSEEFRAHDYQLGRLNCHLFLKHSFSLPLGNQVLEIAYGPSAQQPDFRTDGASGDATALYQLIPLIGTAAQMPPPPAWPRVTRDDVEKMVARARGRANTLFSKLLAKEMRSRFLRLAVRVGWMLFGRGMLEESVRWTLIKDLTLRDQIEGPTAGKPEHERQIMAALADSAFDLRTAAGISRQFGIEAAAVEAVLAVHAPLIHEAEKARDGTSAYTLKERRPPWYRRLWAVRDAMEWLSGPPVIG